IFGTLLSSQGTDASFVLTLAGFPPGFPSVFPTLPEAFPCRFRLAIRFGGQLEGLAYSVALRLPFGGSDFIRSFRPD
ncbi:hypothetical protein, partial [Streptomyces sp. NPDC048825]|uniref:hypothetical protein n=1 Tax=Streptomyces sp. NPDC048825 TaxID=3365592 RepID=UPI00371806F4